MALSLFTHLWNPAGAPLIHFDEHVYMRKYAFIAQYPNSPKLNDDYAHPHFGYIFLGILLKIIGYPDILSPFANGIANPHLIEMLYFFPRLLVGILGVVDTFLIFKIAERRYNIIIASIASILFAVMPSTELLRHMWVDDIQLPFLLSSILFAMYAANTKKDNKNENRTDKKRIMIITILLSGVFLGAAIFTKIPAFTMIPVVGFLVYTNTKSLKILGYWFIPVILIPLIWPAYAIHIGEFKQWYDAFYYQSHRPHVEGFTFYDSINRTFFHNDPVIFVLGIIGLSYAAIKKDIFLLLWVISFAIFLSSLTYVQYFYWVPVIPAFCIAAARVINDVSSKIGKYKIRNRRIPSRVLTIALVSAIGLFGLINITVIITSNINSSMFEALAFVYKLLPPYNYSDTDNSDIIYLSHYYNYSDTIILDNKFPIKTIIPTSLLKGNETSWSAPLKEKNVNYIEGTFRVNASNSNKTDNHAGIVWADGNNKEYYVFLRQERISIAGTGPKEISSALGTGMTRENGKEYTLKIAYMNNSNSNTTTIRVFLNDNATSKSIQLPNAAVASNNDHISKVGIRSFNSMAQFEPVKIGTVSTHQFQDNNKIGNVATLRGNETSWSAPLKEKNVDYIEGTFRVNASNSNKTDNHAGIVWVDGNNKEYYVFLRQERISIVGTGPKEITTALGTGITRENGKEYTLKAVDVNGTVNVFLNDVLQIVAPKSLGHVSVNNNITNTNANISHVGIRTHNSMAQFDPVKIGTVSTHQFQDNNNNTIQLVSNKILNYKYNLTMISDPRYEWIPHYIFHREYGYSIFLTDAKGNFTFLVDDNNLLPYYEKNLDAPWSGRHQIQLYYNSTHIIARSMPAPTILPPGFFNIRTS